MKAPPKKHVDARGGKDDFSVLSDFIIMGKAPCTCAAINGKTQCIGIGSPNSNNTVYCKKAERQRKSAEAVERQRNAPEPPPKPELSEIVSDILNVLLDMAQDMPRHFARLEDVQSKLNKLRYGS